MTSSQSFDPLEIPGADALKAWYGCFPSFHDAEILYLHLNRTAPSKLAIHMFELSDDLDDANRRIRTRQALVIFLLEGVSDLDLERFNSQNVIYGLSISPISGGYNLLLDGVFGITGSITAREIRIELQPGEPAIA